MTNNSKLVELYILMKRIRTFEERVSELFIKGHTAGSMLHLSIGEEIAAASMGKAMLTILLPPIIEVMVFF